MLKRLNLGSRGDEGKVATARGAFTIPRDVQPVGAAMPLDIASEQGTCWLSRVPQKQAALTPYVENGSQMVRKWFGCCPSSGVGRVWVAGPTPELGRPAGRSVGRKWFANGSQMVRKWFGCGSGVGRVWCRSQMVRKWFGSTHREHRTRHQSSWHSIS